MQGCPRSHAACDGRACWCLPSPSLANLPRRSQLPRERQQVQSKGGKVTDQRQIERAGVVGAGLIGRSWAVVFAASGLEVRLCDNDAARLDDAMHWIDANIVELADVGILEDA